MAGGTPYDERLYHLDLCILSYQLYTQSLLWPMDPYSEQMARPWTNRRDAFLARARRRFAERRVPGHLDPILTDLRRLGPDAMLARLAGQLVPADLLRFVRRRDAA